MSNKKKNKGPRWFVPAGLEPTEMDRIILSWQEKGKLVPTPSLIKTQEQIQGIRKAGELNTAVLDCVAEHIREGMSTLEIDKLVYDYTTSHGGIPALPVSTMWFVMEFPTSTISWRKVISSMLIVPPS